MGTPEIRSRSGRTGGRAGIALILLLAAGLRLWGLDKNGHGNLYQAAAIRSMSLSWHNFFYVSFDPAGFLTLDKPPVAFWIEAACVRMLGFHPSTIHLPQALEGVAAVALTYYLVRRRFGAEAALIAGFTQAVMPVSVAVDRSNYADSCLVLLLLLAAWALSVAVERGRLLPLLVSAALIGVGFNTKMLVAFGVVPAFVLVYLAGARVARGTRLAHLAAAFALLVVVSASWGAIVDLTPADRRPYVASSRDNSVLGLVLGHNGLERILGLGGAAPASPLASYIPAAGRAGMPGFGGPPGPLRMANREMAGQVTWLFPAVLIGAIAAWVRDRPRLPLGPRPLALLLWAGWLVSYAVVFSLSRGIIHPYYLAVLAPPLAALFGIGASALRASLARGFGGAFAALIALALTAWWQAIVLSDHPAWSRRLLPLVAGGAAAAATGIVVARRLASRWPHAPRLERASFAIGLAGVLLAPACWSLMPVIARGNPMIPVADPSLLSGREGLASPPMDPSEIEPLVTYLRARRRDERCLLATTDLIVAASIIVESGEPVIATHGFLGTDAILSPVQLAQMIAARQLRFVLTPLPVRSVGGRLGEVVLGRPADGGRVVDPAIWRPDLAPSTAAVARMRVFTVPSGRPVSALGLLLRQMQLIDCAPVDRPAGGIRREE